MVFRLDSVEVVPDFNFGRLKINSFENLKVGKLKGLIAVRLVTYLKELKKKSKLISKKNPK